MQIITKIIEIEIDELEEYGDYWIKIRDPKNYEITHTVVEDTYGTLTLTKAVLYVAIDDLVIDEGATIDTNDITATITGYVNGESQDDVIQYRIEDKEGNEYTPGATGVYFIKIVEPDNYRIEYTRLGTVYVNSNDANRKIRTYTDCVEDSPSDSDNLDYIAHFRYVNPNDEAIYILAGSENQLTGLGAPTDMGGTAH